MESELSEKERIAWINGDKEKAELLARMQDQQEKIYEMEAEVA